MADTETTANQAPDETNGLESLEDQDSTLVNDNANQTPSPPPVAPPEHNGQFKRLRQRTNIYLLLFGVVILLAGIIILIAYLQDQHSVKTNRLQTQSLSQSTLQQLANNDATVGSNQSVLNVQSSAVFAGQVLIRQNLEIAGNLQIGGTLALSNLTVSGTSQFGQATVNQNLAVAGNTAIQGATTIAKSLQVNGNGTFSGALSVPQITTSSLQLNGDLVLTHHISVGGSTPTRSGGTALGGGGSVSVSGSDTAGSITINTGSNPAAGCFVTVTFTAKYNATPHVLATPIGSAAGGLSYYVTRSTTNFSICDSTTPPAGSSFGFDYFVLD